MIPLALFRVRSFFQLGWGDSPLTAGLRFLPWTATPLLVAPLAGGLSDRIGARLLMVPGLMLQAAGFAWIVVLAGSGSGYDAYLAPFIIAGVGVSMAIPTIPAAALNAVDPSALGKASAILNTLRQFGAPPGRYPFGDRFESRASIEADLRDGLNGFMKGSRPEFTVRHVRSLDERTAAAGGTATITGIAGFDGTTMEPSTSEFSMICTRDHGGWQIAQMRVQAHPRARTTARQPLAATAGTIHIW
jgi:hypothetical protein